MTKNLFYTKGVDKCNAKSMWNFLKHHYTYSTLNSWNNLQSVANNVKVYNLELDGDSWNALRFLEEDEYFEVNCMLEDFHYDHKEYDIGFNGRSGGYLVLYNHNNSCNVLPDYITTCDTYEEFKEYAKNYYGSVKNALYSLRNYTELVQDFDKLCDDIRDLVNYYSTRSFTADLLFNKVELFNDTYYNDLKQLGLDQLIIEDNRINISQLNLQCLKQTLEQMLSTDGVRIMQDANYMWLEEC